MTALALRAASEAAWTAPRRPRLASGTACECSMAGAAVASLLHPVSATAMAVKPDDDDERGGAVKSEEGKEGVGEEGRIVITKGPRGSVSGARSGSGARGGGSGSGDGRSSRQDLLESILRAGEPPRHKQDKARSSDRSSDKSSRHRSDTSRGVKGKPGGGGGSGDDAEPSAKQVAALFLASPRRHHQHRRTRDRRRLASTSTASSSGESGADGGGGGGDDDDGDGSCDGCGGGGVARALAHHNSSHCYARHVFVVRHRKKDPLLRRWPPAR